MGRVLLLLLIVWTDTIVLVWGLAMAAYKVKAPLNDLAFQSTVFAFGATLLHSTACVINDICDVDFDRQLGAVDIMIHASLPFGGLAAIAARR